MELVSRLLSSCLKFEMASFDFSHVLNTIGGIETQIRENQLHCEAVHAENSSLKTQLRQMNNEIAECIRQNEQLTAEIQSKQANRNALQERLGMLESLCKSDDQAAIICTMERQAAELTNEQEQIRRRVDVMTRRASQKLLNLKPDQGVCDRCLESMRNHNEDVIRVQARDSSSLENKDEI